MDSEVARTALREILNTEDLLLRIAAAEALGRIDPDQDVTLKTMMGVLTDRILSERYPSAVAAAIQALGRLRERGRPASPLLISVAKNERKASSLRAEACLTLWRIGHDSNNTLPVLSDLLKATGTKVDFTVLATAAQVIAEMGPAAKRVLPVLVTQLEKEPVARSQPAAPKVSGEVIAQMEKQLASAPPKLKANLEKIIRQLKKQRALEPTKTHKEETATPEYTPSYFAFLDAGFDAIAKVDKEDAAIRLIKLLSVKNLTIRYRAMESLLSVKPEHSVRRLLDAVATTDAGVSGGASRTLSRLGQRAQPQLPLLIKSLVGRDDRVRVAAAEVLGMMGNEARSAVPDLERMLQSEKTEVQLAAADALGRIVGAHSGALVVAVEIAGRKDSVLLFEVISSLGILGRQSEVAVTTLIGMLKHESPFICYAAATTLGNMGPSAKRAIPALKNVEEDRLFHVRDAANGAILKLEDVEK